MNISSNLVAAITLSLAAISAACGGSTAAPQLTAPTVPDAIKAPATEKVFERFHATGVQIYTCKSMTPMGGGAATWAWTFKAPEATLTDDSGTVQAQHSAGPTWKANDGSSVVGMVAAKAASPSGSIPWLLLTAASHDGTGMFSSVTSVQRVDTTGGVAPTSGCDMSQDGMEVRVDYTATYYFYEKI